MALPDAWRATAGVMALPAAADVLPVGDFQIYLLATCMPLFGEGAHR
ncbi:hypothetical protein PR002_g27289, partial [Phytophthora rubi]